MKKLLFILGLTLALLLVGCSSDSDQCGTIVSKHYQQEGSGKMSYYIVVKSDYEHTEKVSHDDFASKYMVGDYYCP